MRSIMAHTNDITKYCACASAQKQEDYNIAKKGPKIAAKDSSMSAKMRYSVYLRTVRSTAVIVPPNPALLPPTTRSQKVSASF